MAKVTRIAGRVFTAIARHHQQRRELRQYRRVIAELHGYSDAQLEDLGLNRGEIHHAVRYGRPGPGC